MRQEDFNIKDFCGKDTRRSVMMAACEIDGMAYATDWYVGIRVKSELAGNPGSTAEGLKLYEKLPVMFSDAKQNAIHWFQLKGLPPLPKCSKCEGKTKDPQTHECPECGGDGKVDAETDFNTYEVECKTCDGDGEILGPGVCKKCRGYGFEHFSKPVGCDVFGVRLNLELLHRIKDLPGLKIGVHGPELTAHYFSFDYGDGVIMPLRMLSYEANDCVFEFTEEHFTECEPIAA